MIPFGVLQGPQRIGVEVGARTLKAAWVAHRPGGRTAWQFVQCPRSHDAGPEALQRDLSQLLRPLYRQRFLASLTLAAPTSYVRSLTLQVADLKRLPDAVREQLPQLLPFDVDRAQVQFRVRRRQPVDGQWDCLVSVAACDAASLRQELEALWQAGWGAHCAAPAALALVHAAKALDAVRQDPVVMMEIGERRTTIVLVEDGEVMYARDVALGMDHFIDALTAQVSVGDRTISLSREEAQALLQTVGIPEPAAGAHAGPREIPVTTYVAMIQPVLEQLVSEVKRTMTSGTHAAKAASPGGVLISGEGSRMPNCDQWFSKQLAVPVARLTCERFVGSEGKASAITCGLALCDRSFPLDLQPPPFRRRWALTRTAAMAWRGLAVVTMGVWLGAGLWYVRDRAVSHQVRALEARRQSLQPVVALRDAVEAHTLLVRRLTIDRGVPVDWFRRLATDFPIPVRLTKLVLDAEAPVSMEGQAQERDSPAAAALSSLTLWLGQATLCGNTQLGSSHPQATDDTLVAFSLTCQLLRN